MLYSSFYYYEYTRICVSMIFLNYYQLERYMLCWKKSIITDNYMLFLKTNNWFHKKQRS